MAHKKRKMTSAERLESNMAAVLSAMSHMASRVRIGGRGSEDGVYAAGFDDEGNCTLFTHFDRSDVARIENARRKGCLMEYLQNIK